MKILFLAQQLPYPLDSGGKIKSYHVIEALARKHAITIVSFIRSKKEDKYIWRLNSFADRVETCLIKRSSIRNIYYLTRSLLTSKSFVMKRDQVRQMRGKINRLLELDNYDVIHIDHLQMAQYVDDTCRSFTFLDQHNVESMIWKRISENSNGLRKLFARNEARKLQRFEAEACSNSDLVLTVTERDKEILSSLTNNRARIQVVPIGVDCDYFKPMEASEKNPTITFVGTMFWPPNIECVLKFHRETFPLICKEIPEVKFKIVGSRPSKKVQNFARDKNVEVTGYVDDVRPLMAESSVFIVPLLSGSGMRVKILNAMSMGIPVVTTSIGCEGIEGLISVDSGESADENIWIADTPEEFAGAVATVMSNKELSLRLSRNARQLMLKKYDWSIIQDQILKVYRGIEASLQRKKKEQIR